MRWPVFFSKPKKPAPEINPPGVSARPAEPKPVPAGVSVPTIKPVPIALQGAPVPKPVPIAVAAPAPLPVVTPTPIAEPPAAAEVAERSTRTLPAMHGVVLRPPALLTQTAGTAASAAPAPIKSIEQMMAEADPLNTLRQTGSVLVTKLDAASQTAAALAAPTAAPRTPAPAKIEPVPVKPAAVVKVEPAFSLTSSRSITGSLGPKHSIPPPRAPSLSGRLLPKSANDETPFIVKSTVNNAPAADGQSESAADAPRSTLPGEETAPAPVAAVGVFRRRAKMTDLAKIVLPPRREEHESLLEPPQSTAAVIPPSFPISVKSGHLPSITENKSDDSKTSESPEPKSESAAPIESAPAEKKPVAEKAPIEEVKSSEETTFKPEPHIELPPEKIPAAGKPTEPPPEAVPPKIEIHLETPHAESSPQLHQPEPVALSHEMHPISGAPAEVLAAKNRIDAGQSTVEEKPTTVPTGLTPTVASTEVEKREFHLANGERVVGKVISETPESIYLEHGTMGVITIPRGQIAKRLVEIILLNGDRIVGDIMAETADTLYVRHASLGMLTVPRSQRSTRVVEVILKDGDRILGEVLTESPLATVIKSATLGTVTIPHTQLAMLNRKVEEIELRAMPALKDKDAA